MFWLNKAETLCPEVKYILINHNASFLYSKTQVVMSLLHSKTNPSSVAFFWNCLLNYSLSVTNIQCVPLLPYLPNLLPLSGSLSINWKQAHSVPSFRCSPLAVPAYSPPPSHSHSAFSFLGLLRSTTQSFLLWTLSTSTSRHLPGKTLLLFLETLADDGTFSQSNTPIQTLA